MHQYPDFNLAARGLARHLHRSISGCDNHSDLTPKALAISTIFVEPGVSTQPGAKWLAEQYLRPCKRPWDIPVQAMASFKRSARAFS
jgi:hypothetical protein